MPVSFSCRYLLGLLLLLAGCAEPSTPPKAIPDPKTLGEAYVSNPDSVLRPATVRLLNRQLQALDQAGRAHIDVAVARSIGDSSVKDMATALFNRWKIGDKDKNNGLLMLVVLDQHRVEFETGYGLEADLPDIICFRIQQQRMLPRLRAGQYDSAVIYGIGALITRLQATDTTTADPDARMATALEQPITEYDAAAPTEKTLTPHDRWIGMAMFFSLSCFFLFMLAVGVAPTDYRSFKALLLGLVPVGIVGIIDWLQPHVGDNTSLYAILALSYLMPLGYLHWTVLRLNQGYYALPAATSRQQQYTFLTRQHGSLATFFSALFFPVGMLFYWIWNRRRMHQLRAAPYTCPNCAGMMHRLSETQDDVVLGPGKAAEEQVQSIDYDVFQCTHCPHTLTIEFKNLDSGVKPCPQCKFRTLVPQKPTVELAPTTSADGWGWKYSCCANCHYETPKTKYHLPRITSSNSSASYSSSDSSSSSSDSSSSSSGGSSGGGGSGSSW